MPSAIVQKAISLAAAKDSPETLTVSLNGKTVERGQYVPRSEAQQPPQLSFSGAGPYLAVSIDPDAPFISFPIMGPVLHWVHAGLIGAGEGGALSTGSTPVAVQWAPPQPPPGAAPHRYLLLIYEQPSDFEAKKFFPAAEGKLPVSARMRWNMEKFEREAKLGPIVAATYFTSN